MDLVVTKVMVVEDQALVRDAISALIDLEDNYQIVAQCTNGEEAINTLKQRHSNPDSLDYPDLILSDIEMPVMSGISLAENIKELNLPGTFVIMTTFAKSGYIKRAMAAGAAGFILKEAPSEYLLECLDKISQGQRVIEPELAMMALDDNDPLSDKERKALGLALDGLSTQEIAKSLFLSEGTVRNYLSEAISKLDASNRIDAGRIAKQKGWL